MAKSPANNIQPLHDYVLVRPLDEEKQTASGIIIPDTANKEKPQTGEVIAVGPGTYDEDGEKLVPMVVKPGQKVLYKKWGGNEIKVGREEWMLIEQKDIMAVVK
jgi:chaperonin GroES